MAGQILTALLETSEDLLIGGLKVFRLANMAIGTAVDSFIKGFESYRPQKPKAPKR